MMNLNDLFLQTIQNSLTKLKEHKVIAIKCSVSDDLIILIDSTIDYFIRLENLTSSTDLSINYVQLFHNDILQITNYLPYDGYRKSYPAFDEEQKKKYKDSIENNKTYFENQLIALNFNLDFFYKLDFFNKNIVAIGANGSGKTTLSYNLKKYLPNAGVVISAQKILIVPTFSSISNYNDTNGKLVHNQNADNSLRVTYNTENGGNLYSLLGNVGNELQILLDNLLAERSSVRNKFVDTFKNDGNDIKPTTKLDKLFLIWNSLIEHRTIACEDGINIFITSKESVAYPAYLLSDGEKVILYLIAQVLQAPTNGFIVVDEPEMYLHKTILKKLWDKLETERQDCIFVYLTHDLDFATSRNNSKKVWIRSYKHPDKWEIESIPENDLPEPLLLELLGSRKKILFCEGKKGSNDEKIYNILFSEYTITPVENCFNVINYTKAFNRIQNTLTKAFGIIDADHHDVKRLETLIPENIFSFSMAEPENLLLDENFLRLFANKLMKDNSIVDIIKNKVIEELNKDIDLQTANYVSTKIDYYFKDSHVSRGNDLNKVEENYKKFIEEIKINEWFTQRKGELQKIVSEKNYQRALSLYNNKGLKKIANHHLSITDFTDRAIKFLQHESTSHDFLLQHFPEQLKESQTL